MSLQTRLAAFITSIGADIKALQARPSGYRFIAAPGPPGFEQKWFDSFVKDPRLASGGYIWSSVATIAWVGGILTATSTTRRNAMYAPITSKVFRLTLKFTPGAAVNGAPRVMLRMIDLDNNIAIEASGSIGRVRVFKVVATAASTLVTSTGAVWTPTPGVPMWLRASIDAAGVILAEVFDVNPYGASPVAVATATYTLAGADIVTYDVNGPAGFSVATGTGNDWTWDHFRIEAPIGEDTDTYHDITAMTLYGPRQAGVWGSARALT